MISSIFIGALGQAIFESCGQALLIYVVLQLAMQFFPAISSKYRYDVYYLGLVIISCWFLANLVNIYMHDVAMAKYAAVTCSSTFVYGIKYMPTLLQQAEAFISKYSTYITGLYLIGLTLHSFKLIGGFVHVHYIRKQKNLTENSLWTKKVELLSAKLKVLKKVSLYFSEHVQIPLTIGYFKPIIIFPIALINNLDTEQVEAILMHELAHIKRHDYLLNILQCIMETILCFNPFVWLISKIIRQEREYCCDDMVMEEEYNNFTYSKALFIIAQQNNQDYVLAMASANQKKYPLLNRIKRLNTMETNNSLPKFHLLVIVAVAAIGTLLAWGVPQYSTAKTIAHKFTKAVMQPFMPEVEPAPPVKAALPPPPAPPAGAPASDVSTHKVQVTVYRDTAANNNFADTTKTHKTSFKIVITDDNGVKKEYNSLDEMPEADKAEFLKANPNFGALTYKFNDSLKFADIDKFRMSPEFQKQIKDIKVQAEKMNREFKNNPEWKKQMVAMKIDAKKMAEKMNSPEWKKQMADIQVQSKKMAEHFNSPEWKKQVEEMNENAKKMAEEMKNNPEWKKQMADMAEQSKIMGKKMAEQVNSPEFKKQIKAIQIESKKMAEQMNSPKFKKQMVEMQVQAKKMAEDFNNNPEFKKQMKEIQDKVQEEVEKARGEAERAEKAERNENPEKVERPERPEKPEAPEKAERDTVNSDGKPE